MFNNIDFAGYINSYIYILFIIFLPLNIERNQYLFISFLFGLVLDFFMDTGGVHAASCITISFIRPYALNLVYGNNYSYKISTINSTALFKQFGVVIVLVPIHNLILFSLEIFNYEKSFLILKNTIYNSTLTLIFSVFYIVLFSKSGE